MLPMRIELSVTPGALDEDVVPPPLLLHAVTEMAVIAVTAMIARSLMERVMPFASPTRMAFGCWKRTDVSDV